MAQVLLDRARDTTSTLDLVTGGAYRSLGADWDADYLVTPTLPARGRRQRALAIEQLRAAVAVGRDLFVSCGDGSVNNPRPSAVNAAELLAHRRRACPTLFCVTDNGLSISLRTRGGRRW